MTLRPMIGITPDNRDASSDSRLCEINTDYTDAVLAAGGLPVVLSQDLAAIPDILARVDGLVFTGGPDIRMEQFGHPNHPAAKLMAERRQVYELALLDALATAQPNLPVLGICLGMQIMSVHAGARFCQHLPDHVLTAAIHARNHPHSVVPRTTESHLMRGLEETNLRHERVMSCHHQAVLHPGKLTLTATAPDGVIEAVEDPSRAFYVGVQWHPERGQRVGPFNSRLFELLVSAGRRATSG